MNFKIDAFESKSNFKVFESSDKVDGNPILGIVKGQFFVPDGYSRNKRFYSKNLWEKQLDKEDIKSKISEKRMYGTIGHEQPIDDNALLSGKLSHIVTELAIEKNGVKGYGEAIILDTDAGRVLNTFMRAGAGLFTSSRATGKFSGNNNGVPSVDEDSYVLDTFDFVLDPGFLEANPRIAESFSKFCEDGVCNINEFYGNFNCNEEQGDCFMDQKLLEKSINEAAVLRVDLKNALESMEELKNENNVIKDENNHLKDEMTVLEAYKELGNVEDIKKNVEEAKEIVEMKKTVESYKELGTATEIGEALEKLETKLKEYSNIGESKEIDESLDKAIAKLEEYAKLGTPEELDEALDKLKVVVDENLEKETIIKIKELAEELKVSEESIKKVYNKMTEEEIKDLFKSLKESDDEEEDDDENDRFKKEEEEEEDDKKKKKDESNVMNKPLASRLMESFCR